MATTFTTVDEFLSAQTEQRKAEVLALRDIVFAAVPGVLEHIKWNSPSFYLRLGEDRVTVNAHGTGPARLILHAGATTVEDKKAERSFAGDPNKLLTWHSNIRASLSGDGIDVVEGQRERIGEVVGNWFREMG
jgi:hypothetical protein